MSVIKNILFTIIIMTIDIKAYALGAHVHGIVSLDIATDKNELLIMLKSPADSFLSYEYKAKTVAEKQLFNKVKTQWNSDLLSHLGEESLKDCKISSASWKQVFSGKNHSNIIAEAYINCKKPLNNRVLNISIFQGYKNINQIELQVLKENGEIIKKKKKNKLLTVKL